MWLYVSVFILLFLGELLYFRIADYFNIVDRPNHRSSHVQVTLRGGGIIFYFSVVLYFISSGFQYPWFFGGLTLITFISFLDDIRPLHQYTRLIFHFTGVGLLFYQLGLFTLSFWWIILVLIVCTGVINAYNFMDGINGITGGYSFILVSALAYVNNYIEYFVDNRLLIILLAGLLVFNFFNFRKKAKCFAGDVGSVSMAFIVIFLLGKLILQTANISWLVFLAVYGVDSVLTIIHRLLLHERISEPHRKHMYQIMANELKIPHYNVALFYMLIQLMVIVGYLFFYPLYGYLYLFSICTLLSVIYLLFMQRFFHLHQKK